MPVVEAELVRGEPARALCVHDLRAFEDRGPVAPVGSGVHPHAAADRAWNRAGELEAAEPRGPPPVEADRVRSPTACEQSLALDRRLGELAAQLEHEPLEALVGDEEVRAEPD